MLFLAYFILLPTRGGKRGVLGVAILPSGQDMEIIVL